MRQFKPGQLQTGSLYNISASYAVTASYVQNAVSASYALNATSASNAITSSYALTASYLEGYISPFPYTGSAQITGSLGVTGSISSTSGFTGSLQGTASNAVSASFATTASYLINPTISGSISNVNYIDFNTSYAATQPVAGRLSWNNADGTLDLGMKGGNVTQQIGEEIFYEVRNETGTPLENGTSVYANGVTAGSGRITVAPFVADGSVREVRYLGLTTEDISNGVNGFITHFGYVRDLDTRGTVPSSIAVGDETWAVGDILYAHPTVPGKLTNIKPKHDIVVCIIIVRHQNVGSVFVRPSDYGHIDDLHDVNINTSSLSTGDLLIYNSGSDYWTNSKQLTGSYGLTGSLTATSFTGSLQGTASNAISATNALTASYLNTLNQDLTFNGNLTLNGTASIAYLNVQYESASIIYSSGSNQFGDAANDTQTLWGTVDVKTGPLLVTGSVRSTGGFTGSFSGSVVAPGSTTQIVYNNGGVLDANSGFVYSGSRVGIGTTTPSESLEVQGSILIEGSGGRLRLAADIGTQFSLGSVWNGIQDTMFIASSLLAPRIATFQSDGKIGIGTILPSASLHISGASSAALLRVDSPASSSILFVSGSGRVGFGTDTPTQRIDVDGNILLRLGESAASGRLYLRDTITYLYEGSGLNLVSGPTRNIKLNAGNADRLFVSASGLVGIGTNTPLVTLDVRGAAIFNNASGNSYNENIRLPEASTGFASIALGGSIAASGTSATQWTILKHPAASSNTFAIRNNNVDYLSITTAGHVGLGSNFITPTARLQVRGSGATSATTTFLLQNSSPTNLMTVLDNGQFTFSSPIISLATSQSAFTISQSISASNVVGGQYYGVNITPTFFATTASQTETALRVAATFTGSAAAVGGQNIIADFGATSAGSQFTVTDVTSGSIYMVNDVSGLPIIEATSDWTVNMYNFPNKVFEKRGNNVNIYGTLNATGSFILPLSQSSTPQVGSAYWSGSMLFIYDGTQYRSASFA